MSWLRTIAAFAFALAFVCQPAIASAYVPASAEARVGAFEVVPGTLVAGLGAASRGQHQGIGAAYDENASGYRFAAEAGGKWSKAPKTLQDQMTLDAAKGGAGERIISNLGDPKFKGMEKWQYKVKSSEGRDSVVHYVVDPKTGARTDFKFTKHSNDSATLHERTPEPHVSSGDRP